VNAPLVLPLGEAALTIRLGELANVEFAERSAALAEAIRREGIDGVTEVVPAVASVTVYYDAQRADCAADTARLRAFLASTRDDALKAAPFALHTIPAKYDGPDLDDVAQRVALSRDEVVRRHVAREYHVLALGFLPGWAYLGPLDPALSVPRRTTPRTRVPAGSVAIMGVQTGIYPRVSPGGWHLIGTTDTVLFSADRTPPALFAAGDRVRFAPVT
jgi:KipI family sensor histidine kinase inhibitor